MKTFTVLLATLALLATSMHTTWADEYDELELEGLLDDDEPDLDLYADDDDEDSLYGDNTGISLSSALVGGINNQIPLESAAAVLCGVSNGGSQSMNVSGFMGTMHNPADYSQVLINLTARPIFDTLAPGAESTYSYNFKMPASVGAQPLIMTLALVYTDASGKQMGQAVFNETIEFVPAAEEFDNFGFLVKASMVGVLAMAAWAGLQSMIVGKGGPATSLGGTGDASTPAGSPTVADFGDSIKPTSGVTKRRR
jgi:hypothetical protein